MGTKIRKGFLKVVTLELDFKVPGRLTSLTEEQNQIVLLETSTIVEGTEEGRLVLIGSSLMSEITCPTVRDSIDVFSQGCYLFTRNSYTREGQQEQELETSRKHDKYIKLVLEISK